MLPMTKSPSGALSPYYYKGGYFHGIHYGSYFDNRSAFLEMMAAEEAFIMHSPEKKRLMIDLYETDVAAALPEFIAHIERLYSQGRIFKLALSCEKKKRRMLEKALNGILPPGYIYFSADMEEAKTWLVGGQCD